MHLTKLESALHFHAFFCIKKRKKLLKKNNTNLLINANNLTEPKIRKLVLNEKKTEARKKFWRLAKAEIIFEILKK